MAWMRAAAVADGEGQKRRRQRLEEAAGGGWMICGGGGGGGGGVAAVVAAAAVPLSVPDCNVGGRGRGDGTVGAGKGVTAISGATVPSSGNCL